MFKLKFQNNEYVKKRGFEVFTKYLGKHTNHGKFWSESLIFRDTMSLKNLNTIKYIKISRRLYWTVTNAG